MRDTTLDDENASQNNRVCCNNTHQGRYVPANVLRWQHQPEAVASDLSDDQSRYLYLTSRTVSFKDRDACAIISLNFE